MSVLEGPLVFVDIETNGLSHLRGRVVEVAAIRVEDGRIVREFHSLVDPGAPLPQFITDLTGIAPADLQDAPLFLGIADELYDILEGAVFVAHNVRFDYSFLKQEFKRAGKDFRPQQLCTVRLSRALFPQHRSHKLQDIIARHGLQVAARHRAYDDAHALWQFVQLAERTVGRELVEQAVARQIKRPSLPKGLTPESMAALPEGPGVYIFEDEAGGAIYVGKSVNIKKRVASHFMRDHENVQEFKLAQHVRHITTHETAGELQALLLESSLVKKLQPLYNKQLRRTDTLLLARQIATEAGYLGVQLEEARGITIDDVPAILAVYPRRSKARESLERLVKEWNLCPKLLGLENAKGACFQHQLHRCLGACVGQEGVDAYNSRLQTAFSNVRIDHWPFSGPVFIQEKTSASRCYGIVVDQWCVVAEVAQADEYSDPQFIELPRMFDLDAYRIMYSFILHKVRNLSIRPITLSTFRQQFGI